ncbi:MAG: SLC13/DASS family transporter [Dethiobacter sp.]|jgi:anion transporter|nr:MAG: SLC13/DASS family transporter [Dethiobacter sp.]
METSTIALIILAIVVILYITERIPLAVTSVTACVALALFKVVDFSVAFSGFSSNVVFLVGGMIVVGAALFETGVAQEIGTVLVKIAGNNERTVILAVMLTAGILSGFLNNSSTTALFIPVIAGIAASSAGKVRAKNVLLPLAFAANTGGMMTLVGSTPTLVVQGVLTAAGLRPFTFFEFAWIGVPLLVMLLGYMLTVGYRMEQTIFQAAGKTKLPQVVLTHHSEAAGKPRDNRKMLLCSGIMVMCVVLFATEAIPVHLTSMLGATLVIITGCISEKDTYRNMDWTTVFVLAGSMGLAAGLDQSGAGRLVADTAIGALGASSNPLVVMAVITGLAMVLTQFMSNTATVAMLAPIALFMSQGLGISPHPVLMGLATTCAAAYCTPVGTPPNTLVLSGGYRFKDYLLIGGVFQIAVYCAILAIVPLIWPL